MQKVKSVDAYVESKPSWSEALQLLREIFRTSELEETIKWGMPTYVLDGKNVAGYTAFKEHVAIWFYNGVYLSDPGKKLINAQEGITRGQRQWRFSDSAEIAAQKELIQNYLAEAIQNQKEGKELKARKKHELIVPEELAKSLETDPSLKSSFSRLSPGKQREYADYISEAKRPETRLKRLDKILPMILEELGLYDKYKN